MDIDSLDKTVRKALLDRDKSARQLALTYREYGVSAKDIAEYRHQVHRRRERRLNTVLCSAIVLGTIGAYYGLTALAQTHSLGPSDIAPIYSSNQGTAGDHHGR